MGAGRFAIENPNCSRETNREAAFWIAPHKTSIQPRPVYELHDFARSSSAHRVRIALNLKGIEYEPVPVALQEGGQHEPDFRSVNPQGMVPVYSDENILLSQSLAIIEYLDERYPDPPLLPRDIHERARQFAYMIASDIHPLIAFRAISFLRDGFKIDTSGRREWFNYWLIEGLDALELWLSADGGARPVLRRGPSDDRGRVPGAATRSCPAQSHRPRRLSPLDERGSHLPGAGCLSQGPTRHTG